LFICSGFRDTDDSFQCANISEHNCVPLLSLGKNAFYVTALMMISWQSYGLTVQIMLICHSYSDREFTVLLL